MLRHFHCTATSVAQNSPFLLFLEQFPYMSLGSALPWAAAAPLQVTLQVPKSQLEFWPSPSSA